MGAGDVCGFPQKSEEDLQARVKKKNLSFQKVGARVQVSAFAEKSEKDVLAAATKKNLGCQKVKVGAKIRTCPKKE